MGLIFNRGGLQARVHSETPSIWDERNNSAQKEFRYFKCRSGRIIKKICYRKSTSKREGVLFLQHLLSSSQEEQGNETSNKFETTNQVSEERTFQNGHIEKSHNTGERNNWAISLDLSDAYLHIPIFQKHRKYLRFCIAGQCWQWKCLFFGPSTELRVFSKVISVIAAHLRAQNIRLASYLHEWLALNQLKRLLLQDREKCLNLLVALGL